MYMLNKDINVFTDFITLQQLLKLANVIFSGGQAKAYLANNSIIINGVKDSRRGRKLYVGDTIIINNDLCLTLIKK